LTVINKFKTNANEEWIEFLKRTENKKINWWWFREKSFK